MVQIAVQGTWFYLMEAVYVWTEIDSPYSLLWINDFLLNALSNNPQLQTASKAAMLQSIHE